MNPSDLLCVLPAVALIAGALLAVGVDVIFSKDRRATASEFLSYGAIVVALASVVWPLLEGKGPMEGFEGMVVLDNLALFLSLAILLATGLMIILSADYLKDRDVPSGEFHGLVLFGAAGMILLVQAQELITLFIALEILSLSVYVLSGLFRKDPRSNEAAVKYFVIGAFATGFLLYGMALLYGASGSLRISEIGAALRSSPNGHLGPLGLALMAVGLGFKVGAVPFHMWVADVYEGAPTSVTAFMSVSVKAAGFGAFLRVFLAAGMASIDRWEGVIEGLALATMVVGNLLALGQRSVKRMLAYSSVAHTGYVLTAMASLGPSPAREHASAGAVFYLFAYTFMTLGAFAFVIYAGKGGKDAENIEDYAGLAKRRPWAALAMTLFMASLAGIPPAAGFFAKFMVFKAAILAEKNTLVVVGVLSSAVSVYYYLRVAVYMYMHPEPAPTEDKPSPNVGMVVMATAAVTLVLGILPTRFLEQSYRAVTSLLR